MLASVYQPVRDLLAASGALEAMDHDKVCPNVPTAVLAFDERAQDELLAEDLGAVVARIGDLTRVAKRHGSEMTDVQRAAQAEAATELDNLEPGDLS